MSLFDDVKDAVDKVVDVVPAIPDIKMPAVPSPSDGVEAVIDAAPEVELPDGPSPSDAVEAVVDAAPDVSDVDVPAFPDPSDLSDLLDTSDLPGFDEALDDTDEITIDLTGDNDVTTGGDDDLIVTGQGDDTIDAGDGDNIVYADSIPDDGLGGGAGNDRVIGGSDDDLALGGPGDDLLEGRSGHDDASGGDGNDTMLGGEGNDSLDGGPGTDLVDAGDGDDLIVWDALDAELAGSAGFDILGVSQGDLDLSASGGAITGIEVVNMRGGEASMTVLTASDVLSVSDTDALTVLGDAGDSLAAGPGWTAGGTGVAGAQVFTQNVGGAIPTLVVQPDVQTNPDVVA